MRLPPHRPAAVGFAFRTLRALAIVALFLGHLPSAMPNEERPDTGEQTLSSLDAAIASKIPWQLVLAEHLMLINGAHVVSWEQLGTLLEKTHAAGAPSPTAYYTTAISKSKPEIEATRRRVGKLYFASGYQNLSFRGLSERASRRYDRLRSKADLNPDPNRSIGGVVKLPNGAPAQDAQVVLCLDERDTFTITAQGRLQRPLESIVSITGTKGRYLHSPPAGKKHYRLVALHPRGFGEIFAHDFANSTEIQLRRWARVEAQFEDDPEPDTHHGITVTTNLKPPPKGAAWSKLRVETALVRSDAKGLSRLAFVPPGEAILSRTVERPTRFTTMTLPNQPTSLFEGQIIRLRPDRLTERQRQRAFGAGARSPQGEERTARAPTFDPFSGPLPTVFRGHDLSKAPSTIKPSELLDLHGQDGRLKPEIIHVPLFNEAAEVFYNPKQGHYYLQRDPLLSSTRTYYGPFSGNALIQLELTKDLTHQATQTEDPELANRARRLIQSLANHELPKIQVIGKALSEQLRAK